jgi:hypothetical protein
MKYNRFIVLVDNSLEISNISSTPRDLINTHHIMTLIMNKLIIFIFLKMN